MKNLLKKPASGGIPAIENKVITNAKAKIGFDEPIPTQFIKYFGNIKEKPTVKINKENNKRVNKA